MTMFRNASRMIGSTGMALLALSGTAHATSFVFNPGTITEDFSDGELFDDDVDVQGVREGATTLNPGDDITWRYTYTKGGPGYQVLSSDLADIDLLALSGRGTTGATVDVTLQFSDLEGNLFGTIYSFTGIPAAGALAVVRDDTLSGDRDGDDVLGNLQGRTIGDFRINARVTAGRFELTDMTFNWEAGDIEPAARVPEPPALTALSIGLAALVGSGRWKRKSRASGQRVRKLTRS